MNFLQWTSIDFCNVIIIRNTLTVFPKLFHVPCYVYPINFSLISFSVSRPFLKTTQFVISVRGPILWNNCFSKNDKEMINFLIFKKGLKNRMHQSIAANSFSKLILTFAACGGSYFRFIIDYEYNVL